MVFQEHFIEIQKPKFFRKNISVIILQRKLASFPYTFTFPILKLFHTVYFTNSIQFNSQQIRTT